MQLYKFLLGSLAVWRITHLLSAEDGPGDLVVHLRRLAGRGFWGQALDCFYCLSMWTAAPFAIFLSKKPSEHFLLWPALSAGAILIERLTDSQLSRSPHHQVDESEDQNVMLWTEESGTLELG